MSQQDAQAIIDSPGEEFSATIFGDDPSYDNAIVAIPVTWSAAWEGGLSAESDYVATFMQLNEDDSYFDNFDDLYVRIRLYDPRLNVIRTYYTSTLHGYY
jgi:hypothetical protein